MPKPPDRHNPSKVIRRPARQRPAKKPNSINDLLSGSGLLQQAIRRQTGREAFWREFLGARLPPELAARVTQIVEREGGLTVYAESAAWSARLRFAIAEHWDAVQAASPGISRWAVRVQPAAARTGART
jgi:predicted nucleic acid-binding Zn ribbon protein